MKLNQILILILLSLLYRIFLKKKWLEWFILIISIAVLFWLQPISTIRTLDFWLPTFSIALGVISWAIIIPDEIRYKKENIIAYSFVAGSLLIIGLFRFIPFSGFSRYIAVPDYSHILLYLIFTTAAILVIGLVQNKGVFRWLVLGSILFIFVILKNESLSHQLSATLRKINNQSLDLAASTEIAWIGYSYIAFRLIHALIESKKKKGMEISLITYLGYLFYFPAFLAGPIAKIDHYQRPGQKASIPQEQRLLQGHPLRELLSADMAIPHPLFGASMKPVLHISFYSSRRSQQS